MSSASAIRRRVAERLFPGTGCTDGGCIFGHRGGMHTNGGCECLKERNHVYLRMVAHKLARVAEALAATNPSDDWGNS